MKIIHREVKQLLTKSNLPDADYVINPYIGCTHGCIYCYAEFMNRFSNISEKWGDYLVIKEATEELKLPKNNEDLILLSSVTDPYNPYELKYNKTRDVLKKFQNSKHNVEILTKSKYIEKDIDIIKNIENIRVGISLCTLDDEFRKIIEPNASSVGERIETLKLLKDNNISTYLFISPIFPYITDWEAIVNMCGQYVDYILFESLNLSGNYKKNVYNYISSNRPELLQKYKEIYDDKEYSYLINEKIKIEEKLTELNYEFKIYFKQLG